jgi:serine/threonine protein kinase
MQIKIANGRYVATKQLGKGAFGEIYIAMDTTSKKEVAVKLERVTTKSPQLMHEAKVYKALESGGTHISSWNTQHFLLCYRGRLQRYGHGPYGPLVRSAAL